MGVGYVDSALMLSVYWGTVLSVDGRVFGAFALSTCSQSGQEKQELYEDPFKHICSSYDSPNSLAYFSSLGIYIDAGA